MITLPIHQFTCRIMAAITSVAMATFAVFIASVDGNSTCQVAPCKCSFSNIEILRKYIEDKINATIGEIVPEVAATVIIALSEGVDEKVKTEVSNSINTLNATVVREVNTLISRLNATVDDRITTVSATVGAHDVSIAKLLNQPGKFV